LRFYAFHIAVLPWIALAILSFHLVTVWHFGLKRPEQEEGTSPALPILFFPDFLVDIFIAFLLTLGSCCPLPSFSLSILALWPIRYRH